MAVEVPPVPMPAVPLSTTVTEPMSVDERWAAWEAQGAAHHRAVRRKMAVAGPILIIVAGVIVYAFLGR